MGTCKQKASNEDLRTEGSYETATGPWCLREEASPASPAPQPSYLLAVSVTEGQAKVVLLQEVEVLADQIKQHLAPAMFLKRRTKLL